ncbi:condensation domain-containing protein, partial [Chengkuizengella marina]
MAPRDEMENQLVTIWGQVLDIDKIGIQDHFFELGGHSLKAMYLASKIQKEMEISISLKDIFSYPTIEQLADRMQQLDKSQFLFIPQVEEREIYPASSAQKRLYVLQQLEGAKVSYNMPAVMTIKGGLNRTRFKRAIKSLMARHESLRTSFEMVEGELVQRVHEVLPFEIRYQNAEKQEVENLVSKFVKPFDLHEAPLFRVSLIEVDSQEYIFLFDMHHVISDGVSMNILVEDFMQLYEGKDLPKLRVQYKDVAIWQEGQRATEVIQKQEQYWLDQFADEIPVLNLPTDYARPSVQSFDGETMDFHWDKVLTAKLHQLVKETNTTLYMVMLSAYTILLSKYTGQEDIIVGSPVSGRNHADTEGIVGVFVNTLAMRNTPVRNKTFTTFLAEVKEQTLKAMENENYPLEDLIEKLDLERDMSRNPLFSVLFNMLNIEMQEIELQELNIQPYPIKNDISKFDLTLTVIEDSDKLYLSLEYATKLFKRETIERMIMHLRTLAEQIIEDPETTIADMEIVTEKEVHIFTGFNETTINYPKQKSV